MLTKPSAFAGFLILIIILSQVVLAVLGLAGVVSLAVAVLPLTALGALNFAVGFARLLVVTK